jgi:hypothetical protein
MTSTLFKLAWHLSDWPQHSLLNFHPHCRYVLSPPSFLRHIYRYVAKANALELILAGIFNFKTLRIVLKMFILICILKKDKCPKIATCITCLIYTTSMHFSYKNSINLPIHIKHVACDCFPWPSKFEM